jgi:hypothetical protein
MVQYNHTLLIQNSDDDSYSIYYLLGAKRLYLTL